MNCPKCGANLNQGETFCRVCGAKFDPNNQKTNEHTQQNRSTNNIGNSPEDNQLIDAYIGPNASKIKNQKFSFCTFFLGVFYILYRKMWLLGILWYVVSLILSFFLSTYASILSFAINIIISLQFSKLYMNHVRDNVAKIKRENAGKSQAELIAICKKSGGTSIVPVFVLLGVAIAFSVALSYSTVKDIIDDTKDPVDHHESNEDRGKIGILSSKIPNNFEDSASNSESFKRYSYSDENNYCYVVFTVTHKGSYSSAKDYLEKNIFVADGDETSKYTDENINDSKWATVSVSSTDGSKTYHYATIGENQLYEIEFFINKDNGTCSDAREDIIESLEMK